MGGGVPNQEVLDCQTFSELCARADLILSFSFLAPKNRNLFFFSIQQDVDRFVDDSYFLA